MPRRMPSIAPVVGLGAAVLGPLLFPIAAHAQGDSGDAAGAALGGLIGLGFTALWCCLASVGIVLWLGGLILWIVMLVDCAQRRPDEFPGATENTKTVWLVLLIASWFVLGMYWLAALFYYFMVKRPMPRAG